MNTLKKRRFNHGVIALRLAITTWTAVGGSVSAATTDSTSTNSLPPGIAEELRHFGEEIEAQGQRIERLYQALGPQLEQMEKRAARLKKQKEEDVKLALKEVFRSSDEAFNSKLIFLPGTHRLALAFDDRSVGIVALPKGEVEATLTGLDGVAQALAVSANGGKLFAGTTKGSVFMWADGKDTAVKVCTTDGWPVTALATSPDASRIAWACNGKSGDKGWVSLEESLVMVDVATGKKLWAAKVGRGDFQALSFSGDGKTLAAVQHGKLVLFNTDTGRVRHELAHEKYPSGPLSTAMSRDGRLCAVGYAPHGIGIWDAREGKCLRLLKAHSNWVVSLAFTPDGSMLASSAGDSSASVWDVASGREIGRLRFGDGATYVNSVSISDDGRWLAAGRHGEYVVVEMPTANSRTNSTSSTRK